jgi:hypothetical protein
VQRLLALLPAGLIVFIGASGMSPSSPESGPAIKGAFAAISTGDFDKLTAWYRDNLGFKIEGDRTLPSGVRGALLVRSGAMLEILRLPDAKSRTAWGIPDQAEAVHGILKIGFEIDDLDGLYRQARERNLNVFFAPTQSSRESLRTFGLKDPDGNIVQLFGK